MTSSADAATGASVGSGLSDSQLEQRQDQLDQATEPALRSPTGADVAATPPATLDDEQSIDGFAASGGATSHGPAQRAISEVPFDLTTSHLASATSADKNALTFSWKNADTAQQTDYDITIFHRANLSSVVFDSGWVASARQTSVTLDGLAAKLADNELYYWRVSTKYGDGSTQTSAATSFVTAVGGDFASTSFSWTSSAAVSNLIRASVPADVGVEKAMLTVTALDTEAARRNVFNAYVNGTEVGVGPTRRAGNALYYNTYDVTKQLRDDSTNVIGLYDYSQATDAGVLIQLTYFHSDGTKSIVYNSGRDRAATQITPMDSVVYGTSKASLGTGYYTDLAQNTDTTKFPYAWQDAANMTADVWSKPVAVSIPTSYLLTPSIVAATTRSRVSPSTVKRNSDGSWTVDFGKEMIGDISLTATAAKKTGVRITLGEQISGGKAVYRMRTGNVYDETWQYKGENVNFSGYSLMGFRYVTLYNYPGTLVAAHISALNTVDPAGTGAGSVSTASSLLNSIYTLGTYSQKQGTEDPVVDSVTRERRPYEGDTLVYQAISDRTSDNITSVRNTWNYLLANPTQYTEYRLMTIMGIYDDYMRTGDTAYVTSVYAKLQKLLATVTVDPKIGLARDSGGTVDLVDWPRSELSGYDLTKTTYKTVINGFAFRAYADMGALAGAVGDTTNSASYQKTAETLQAAMNSKLYSSANHAYIDGLTNSGAAVSHTVPQDTYTALALGVPATTARADGAAQSILTAGKQAYGSIYMAYFFYEALAQTGHGRAAIAYLESTSSNDVRTYAHVLNSLGATMAPEAWSTASKPNMTFSHVWGVGGPIGLVDSILDAQPTAAGGSTYDVTLGMGTLKNASATVPTMEGPLSASLSRDGTALSAKVTVPAGMQVSLRFASDEHTASETVDGKATDPGSAMVLTAGSHTIAATVTHGSDSLSVRRGISYYFKNTISGGRADTVVTYGKPSDSVLVGDWNGDGVDTLAVRRGLTYYFKNSIAGGTADTVIAYGKPSDRVLVGDWDGDGVDTLAVRRGISYYFKNSISGGRADTVIAYGKPSDTVLVGDWDGK